MCIRDRNKEAYGDDILAPANYDISYEFAAVMVANPVVWMEVSHLSPDDRRELAECTAVYRKIRKDFFRADISPIGDMPDGVSFSGFQISCGPYGYLLLFREASASPSYDFHIPGLSNPVFSHILSNADKGLSCFSYADGILHAKMEKPRSFVLLKYECKQK